MERIVAYCGLVCSDCPAYVATQTGNRELLERTASEWSQAFHASITPESILCDSCIATSDRLCSHCYECEVRLCGVERGVANCAVCPDYGCQRLEAFLAMAPDARQSLEQIRAGL
jgi:hypothetical protein